MKYKSYKYCIYEPIQAIRHAKPKPESKCRPKAPCVNVTMQYSEPPGVNYLSGVNILT